MPTRQTFEVELPVEYPNCAWCFVRPGQYLFSGTAICAVCGAEKAAAGATLSLNLHSDSMFIQHYQKPGTTTQIVPEEDEDEDEEEEGPPWSRPHDSPGFECPNCGDTFTQLYNELPEEQTAYEMDEGNYMDGISEHSYSSLDHEEIKFWECPNGCLIKSKDNPAPVLQPLWECKDCEVLWTEQESAEHCCH